jgi:hypothetical protein
MSRLFLSCGLLEQAEQAAQRAIQAGHSIDIKHGRELLTEIAQAKAAI